MEWFKRAWRGDERLWIVFWLYGGVAGLCFTLIGITIKAVSGLFSPLGIGYIAVRVVYTLWLMVSEWRCAFNTDWPFWGYVVRSLIVVAIVSFFVGIVVGAVMVGQDLTKAAECRHDMKAYVAKGGTDVEGFKRDCIARMKQGAASAVTSEPMLLPPVPSSVPAAQVEYYKTCQKTMFTYAHDRGADPQAYMDQNQAYLQQCMQYYANQKNAGDNKSQ